MVVVLVTTASFPNRTLVGYLRILPPTAGDEYVQMTKVELKLEAIERLTRAGFVVLGEPSAMVVHGRAVEIEDPTTGEQFGFGEAIGVFVEVRVQPPDPA